jgi:Ser/Thr protein kinase RdoA (MazF antagonist)
LVQARAAALHSLLEDDPRRVDDASHTALVATLPSLRRSAERLEAVGMPVTLNHNDLHEHNVFVPGSDGRLRFFDLGDAVLAHPMTVLLVPLNVLCRNLDVAPDDRRVRRVVDAYLEVWSDLVPSDVSRAVVPDALRLGRFCRHESWWRVLPALDEAELAEYGDTAAYWLTCMADPPARKTDR